MHFAFKFPNSIEVIDCEKRFAARRAKILKTLPLVARFTGRAFEMSQKHKTMERIRPKLKRRIGRSADDAKYFSASPTLINIEQGTARSTYFFGVGDVAGPAPCSSIPNVQWVSTFLPSDFALTITVQVLSRSFCVTW